MDRVIIDAHTHAFEDRLAAKAIPFLEQEGHIQAYADGRVADVMAQGVWHARDGETLRMGMFENPQADKA